MIQEPELFKVGKPTANPERIGDVVFVHGLNGKLRETWSSKNGFWPEWLAEDCLNIDVWSFGYQASATGGPGAAMALLDRANTLLAILKNAGLGTKPVCFITHSMGGLLVKKMLRNANDLHGGEFRSFTQFTRGIIFLATPHMGSDLAKLAKYFSFFLRTTVAVDELQPAADSLLELDYWYSEHAQLLNIKTQAYFESRPTPLGFVVDKKSANPHVPGVVPFGLDGDHFSICKPLSKQSLVYGRTKLFVLEVLSQHEQGGEDHRNTAHQAVTSEAIETRYRKELQERFKTLPLGGIAPRVQDRVLKIPLHELFVPVQAAETMSLQTMFETVGRGFQAVRTGNPHLVGLHEIKASPRVVILGDPGAGKSTLLRWMVLDSVSSPDSSAETISSNQPLPLFVRLVQFADTLAQQPSLTLEHYLREKHFPPYQSLLEDFFDTGYFSLFLDGLDEVADANLRRQVRDAIELFTIQFPHVHRIVVTSRTVGYRNAQFDSSFRHFTLQPFARNEIAQFIHNWYQAVYRLSWEQPNKVEAERRANLLIEGLQDKPQILQLSGTPLLLAVIALMDWKGKVIPQRRIELYDVATQTLLEDWPLEQGRPTIQGLSKELILSILARLAYEMFEIGRSVAIRGDELERRLINLIQDDLKCSMLEANTIGLEWIRLLNEQSGLLLDTGTDEFHHPIYTFLHLSFAEYLTGCALAEQWSKGPIDLIRYANEPRWREVILLMAGHIGMGSQDEATRLVKEIYALDLPQRDVLYQSLVLVAACLADDVQVVPDLRNTILSELIPLWQSSTYSRLKSKLFRILAAMCGTDSATEVIERIIPLLNDDHVQIRSSILELLGNLGRASDSTLRTRLLTALDDPAAAVKRAAIRALDMLGLATDLDVRDKLLQVVDHPDATVRISAIRALGVPTGQDEIVTQTLLRTVRQDPMPEVRAMAARVLAGMKRPDDNVLATLLATMHDANGTVRKEAIAGLTRWDEQKHQQFIKALQQALQDPDIQKRRNAIVMVSDLGTLLPRQALDFLFQVAEREREQELLVLVLRSFGRLPTTDGRVLDLLVNMSMDKNFYSNIRNEAVSALRQLSIRRPQVSLALTQLLTDTNTALRRNAAEALGKCGIIGQETLQALNDALSDTDELVKLSAATALLELDVKSEKAQAMLLTFLHSKGNEIRRLAIQRLQGRIRNLAPHDIRTLVNLVRNDPYRAVRESALLALAELGHKADAEVMAACRAALYHEYHGVCTSAAEALGRIGQADDATISDLLVALVHSNGRVRLAASNALIMLGEGPERETIIRRVRELLDQKPNAEDVLNTLWGLVVGE